MATDHIPVHLDAVSHRFIETNGLRIHIAEQGTGPLLLLCHGFPETLVLLAQADPGSG